MTLFGKVVVGDLQVRNIKRSRVQLNHLVVFFFFVCVFVGALNMFFFGCEFRKPFGRFFVHNHGGFIGSKNLSKIQDEVHDA